MALANMDLNLLLVLDAVLRERNVSKAAKALHVTQPAVSNALARLRAHLGDPLLVRTPQGMMPTPRAEALAPAVAQALRDLDQALFAKRPFDPATARRDFRVSVDDYAAYVLGTKLAAKLAKEAPGLRLEFLSARERLPLDDLARGDLDGAIRVATLDQAGFFRKPLLAETMACLTRKRHPLVKKSLSLDAYVALPHVLVSPYGGTVGTVEGRLAAVGRQRRVALVVPHFTLAPLAVRDSDAIVTLPRRVARAFAGLYDLAFWEPPLALDGFEAALLWHERTHHDPACRWLRQTLHDVAKTQ